MHTWLLDVGLDWTVHHVPYDQPCARLACRCHDWQSATRGTALRTGMQEPAAARPKPPPGRRHVAPGQQQQPGVVSITEELAHAPPANRPARSRGFVLNPMCGAFHLKRQCHLPCM